jgi:hypothetical protein
MITFLSSKKVMKVTKQEKNVMTMMYMLCGVWCITVAGHVTGREYPSSAYFLRQKYSQFLAEKL